MTSPKVSFYQNYIYLKQCYIREGENYLQHEKMKGMFCYRDGVVNDNDDDVEIVHDHPK